MKDRQKTIIYNIEHFQFAKQEVFKKKIFSDTVKVGKTDLMVIPRQIQEPQWDFTVGREIGEWEFIAKYQGGDPWMDSYQEEASRIRGVWPHRPNQIFAADKQG